MMDTEFNRPALKRFSHQHLCRLGGMHGERRACRPAHALNIPVAAGRSAPRQQSDRFMKFAGGEERWPDSRPVF
jgi:hypothetical protein